MAEMLRCILGVTPKQHSSGGKTIIVGIDKQGGNKEGANTS